MALSCDPQLLIADEPTTALDVTTQAQMQMIFQDPFSSLNPRMTLFEVVSEPMVVNPHAAGPDGASRAGREAPVAHDLSVVKHISDRVAVMYVDRAGGGDREPDPVLDAEATWQRCEVERLPAAAGSRGARVRSVRRGRRWPRPGATGRQRGGSKRSRRSIRFRRWPNARGAMARTTNACERTVIC